MLRAAAALSVFLPAVSPALGEVDAAVGGEPESFRAPIPELLVSGFGGDQPMWVSKEAALDERGEIRWELFGDEFPRLLESYLEVEPSAEEEFPVCTVSTSCGLADSRPRETLDDLIHHAEAVLRARVFRAAEGFHFGMPARLLELAIERVIRDSKEATFDRAAAEPFYLIFESARFHFADIPMCTMSMGTGEGPQPGDSILLFPYGDPVGETGRVFRMEKELLIFERGGRIEVPARLFDHDEIRAGGNLDRVEALVRGKLAGDESARAFDRAACTPSVLRDLDIIAWWDSLDAAPDYREYWRVARERGAVRRGPAAAFLSFESSGSAGFLGLPRGVRFDLDADGVAEVTSWPGPETAILWRDRDGDGRVTDGRELFGDHAPIADDAGPEREAAVLALFDGEARGGDGDGRLTPADAVWRDLRLWVDWRRDGISDPDELFRPRDFCLVEISLASEETNPFDGNGNRVLLRSAALRRDSRGKPMSAAVAVLAPVGILP